MKKCDSPPPPHGRRGKDAGIDAPPAESRQDFPDASQLEEGHVLARDQVVTLQSDSRRNVRGASESGDPDLLSLEISHGPDLGFGDEGEDEAVNGDADDRQIRSGLGGPDGGPAVGESDLHIAGNQGLGQESTAADVERLSFQAHFLEGSGVGCDPEGQVIAADGPVGNSHNSLGCNGRENSSPQEESQKKGAKSLPIHRKLLNYVSTIPRYRLHRAMIS